MLNVNVKKGERILYVVHIYICTMYTWCANCLIHLITLSINGQSFKIRSKLTRRIIACIDIIRNKKNVIRFEKNVPANEWIEID